MLNRNYFSHTDPERRSLKERLPSNLSTRQWGENIWTGSGYDTRQSHHLAQMIMAGWMNSPGHRKNILDPGYTHLGCRGDGQKSRGQSHSGLHRGSRLRRPPTGGKALTTAGLAGVGECVRCSRRERFSAFLCCLNPTLHLCRPVIGMGIFFRFNSGPNLLRPPCNPPGRMVIIKKNH